jgi:uncharacterized protein YcnI
VSLRLSRCRILVPAALAAGLLVAGAGAASAHVSVSSADATPGGFGKVTFRVPNESDTASTVDVRIQVPTDTPLTSLRAQPVPGWTVTLTPTQLPEPVKGEDGEITTAVSVVEFRADPGGGIGPGEFQEFALSGGPFPDTDALTFNVLQSYSDGTEAAWIEPTVPGQAEPEHPAPVLQLSAAPDGKPAAGTAAPATGQEREGPSGTAVAALVVGVLGLLAGLAGLGLGLAARRRTVSS